MKDWTVANRLHRLAPEEDQAGFVHCGQNLPGGGQDCGNSSRDIWPGEGEGVAGGVTCATCRRRWRCLVACPPVNEELDGEEPMNFIDKQRTVGEIVIITAALIGVVAILIMSAWKIGTRRAPVPTDATNLWGEAHYRAAQALRAEEP